MNKTRTLIMFMMYLLLFSGCSNGAPTNKVYEDATFPDTVINDTINDSIIVENENNKFRLNTDYITSNPFTIDVGTDMSSDISDWVICDNYENVEVSIKKADTDREITKLPGRYFPISSPYKVTFTNTVTNETIYVELNAVGGIDPNTYDVTSDPDYNPVEGDIIFEPELYNENKDYFYCTNLSVLSEPDDLLPDLAIADFGNQVGQFILPIAKAAEWERPESCYILKSTIEQTDTYCRFHIFINPNQNLEIEFTYHYDSGYEFIIVKT